MLDCILEVIKRVYIAFVGSYQKQVFTADGQRIDKFLLLQMRGYLDACDSFDPLLPQALKDVLEGGDVNCVWVVPAQMKEYMTRVSWYCLMPSSECASICTKHLEGRSEILSLKIQVPCVFLTSLKSQRMSAPSALMPRMQPWISINQTMLIYYKLSTLCRLKSSRQARSWLYLQQGLDGKESALVGCVVSAFCEVVSSEGSSAICRGISRDMIAFYIVGGLIRRLCDESVIDVRELGRIELSGVMLPFVSLGSVISPMKMIMPSVSNKPLPIAQLSLLQKIQIFLKLMLDNRPFHDLVVQLQEELKIQRGSLRLQAAAEGVTSVRRGKLILFVLRIGKQIAIGLIFG